MPIERSRAGPQLAALLAAALATAPALPARAAGDNVWAYEEEGVAHFTNVPDSDRYRLYLGQPQDDRLKPEHRARPAPAPRRLALAGPLPYAEAVSTAAAEHRLDPALLHAVIHVESRHNPAAVSPKGAVGLMQVLPETARRMGVETFRTPEGNIAAGARYLRFLLDTFGLDMNLALAAYNAGENAVIRHGNRIPPYRETQAYVPAVLAAYEALTGGKGSGKAFGGRR